MDSRGFLSRSVNKGLGAIAESFALWRAGRSAQRRARQGFDIPRGVGSTFTILFLLACGATGFVSGGHYDAVKREHGSLSDALARSFGFGIESIAVAGNTELQREEVIALSGINLQASLPFLDPKAVQARLMQVPLIAEASVGKLYPDRLKIDIKERVPFAIWQQDGHVQVIAADGTPIENLNDARFLRLPHVVGKGANLRVKEFVALLDSAPDLAGQIRAGTLVSGRRWTLKLQNGVDVKLPEEGAEAALKAFSNLEHAAHISGRAVLAIDLRIPDRVIVRLTEEAAAQHAETMTAKIKKMGGRV